MTLLDNVKVIPATALMVVLGSYGLTLVLNGSISKILKVLIIRTSGDLLCSQKVCLSLFHLQWVIMVRVLQWLLVS